MLWNSQCNMLFHSTSSSPPSSSSAKPSMENLESSIYRCLINKNFPVCSIWPSWLTTMPVQMAEIGITTSPWCPSSGSHRKTVWQDSKSMVLVQVRELENSWAQGGTVCLWNTCRNKMLHLQFTCNHCTQPRLQIIKGYQCQLEWNYLPHQHKRHGAH